MFKPDRSFNDKLYESIKEQEEFENQNKPHEHIMAIEFTKSIARYEVPMVALFNDTVIDGVTVRDLLKKGKITDHDDKVVIIYKTQYDALCGKVKEE